MLSIIQHYIEQPDDIPDIPKASAEYLNVRLNASYLIRTGILDEFRKAGATEQFLLGFVEGCSAVTEIIELMQEAQSQRTEEGD